MITVNNRALNNYKFIDLFCGIGGFHLALSSFGAECVFASDIDTNVCAVYENNFHFKPMGDIKSIKSSDIPNHDFLCAGFPCQPFSISGHQKGFNDEQGRGKLFFQIIRIAKEKKPKVILLENVRNLRFHDGGRTFNVMKNLLENGGYSVFDEVLCASDFGIPQARKRLYIVAIRKEYNILDFNFPSPLNDFRILKDILIEKDDKYDVSINQKCYFNEKAKFLNERFRHLIRIGYTGCGRQGERIYSILGQAATLSAQGGGPGGKTGMYLINDKVRKLYPRECARLMGFPDTYLTSESIGQCYKQFGNSIVVDVVQYIIIEILKQLGRL